MLQNQLSLGMQSFSVSHSRHRQGAVLANEAKESSESGNGSVTHRLSCRLCEQQSRKETRTEKSLNSPFPAILEASRARIGQSPSHPRRIPLQTRHGRLEEEVEERTKKHPMYLPVIVN